MTKITQGVAALAALFLTLHDDAQSLNPSAWDNPGIQTHPTPEPINLDIPPDEPPDPDQVQEQQLAELAILNPEDFHALLLKMEPGRPAREQAAAFAILNPGEFRRAHPKTPVQLQEEVVGARAILNVLGLLPSPPNHP